MLEAAPDYIEVTTGLTREQQENEALAEMVTKHLLLLWFGLYEDQVIQQRIVDSLIKALSAKAHGST
jgi:hypothetical protein